VKNGFVGTVFCIAKNGAGAAASRSSINELTVLAPRNDPYRLDTTFGHELSKERAERIRQTPGGIGGSDLSIVEARDALCGLPGGLLLNDRARCSSQRFLDHFCGGQPKR